MSQLRKAVLAALVLCFAASAAVAQDAKPWTFGGQAGLAMPIGDFGDGANSGFDVGGFAEFKFDALPVGLRGEALYSSFGGKTVAGIAFPTMNILGVGAGVAWNMPAGLFLVGGAGMYNMSCSGCTSESKLGVNGGAGYNLPLAGFGTFIEARFHSIMTDTKNTNFMPISVGVRF